MGVSVEGHLLAALASVDPDVGSENSPPVESHRRPRNPLPVEPGFPAAVARDQASACAPRGRTAVFTNGCFDLLHRGHVEYLREARTLGDALMVGLNSDTSVAALKGPGRPLMRQQDRAALLCELRSVSYVCIFEEPGVAGLVAELLPDVLVKGGDYSLAEVVGRDAVEGAGGAVRTLSLWTGASSSDLVRRLKS